MVLSIELVLEELVVAARVLVVSEVQEVYDVHCHLLVNVNFIN